MPLPTGTHPKPDRVPCRPVRQNTLSQAAWHHSRHTGLFSQVAPNSAVEAALHRQDTLASTSSQLPRNPSRVQALYSQASLAEASFLASRQLPGQLPSQASMAGQLSALSRPLWRGASAHVPDLEAAAGLGRQPSQVQVARSGCEWMHACM